MKAPNGGLAEPDVLLGIDRFERWLEASVPGVTKAISIVDVHREFYPPPRYSLAEMPRSKVEQQFAILQQLRKGDMQRLVQADNSIGRITARMRLDRMKEVVHAFEEIDDRLKTEVIGPGVEVEMTGYVRLMGRMEDYLLTSQIRSFAIAFGVITLMMVVLLRSWRLGWEKDPERRPASAASAHRPSAPAALR